MSPNPHLFDAVRYARNVEVRTEDRRLKFQPLVGEEGAFLSVLVGFGMAQRPTVLEAFSGTGKTVIEQGVVSLLPEDEVEVIDMMSAKAIWQEPVTRRINAKRFLVFPELQNAGDNDEVNKILKKLGEGRTAKRDTTGGILENGTRDVQTTEISWHPTLTTMAVENETAKRIFNEESQRRAIIVPTDPSSAQTRKVLKAQARVWAEGVEAVKDMTIFEQAALKRHIKDCLLAYKAIDEVRFLGAVAFEASVPDTFVTARSAFPILQHLTKGVGVWYHKTETQKGGVVFLSPQRFAETLEFYGPIFIANCLKLPAMGRAVIDAFPPLEWEHGLPTAGSMVTEAQLLDRLKARGFSIEKAKVRTVVKRLMDAGFVEENDELQKKMYHLTSLAKFDSLVDWPAILDETRTRARKALGDDAEAWIAQHAQGDSVTYRSPITGEMRTVGKGVGA